MNDHPLPSHSQANEDVGAPGANEDVGAPSREWHSRGYLPHRDRIHLLQSITFRLADSFRDDDHLRATIDYIHRNPVKARLCLEPALWPWSSAGRPGSADVPVGTANNRTTKKP